MGTTDPKIYEQFVEITEKLDREIEEKFKVQKDFELKYICSDAAGTKRKAKISRYILEQLSW